MSATDRRDVIDVLSGDHRAVEVLLQRLETGGGAPGGARKALVDALARQLAWHTAAAQRYLLPLARRVLPDGEALADRHTAEHLTFEHMVRDLEAKDPSDARFEPLLAQLVAAARGHIDHEEQITFVELARECDRGELLAAGEELAAARARTEQAEQAERTELAERAGRSPAVPAQGGPAGAEAGAGPVPSVVDRVRAMLQS